MSKKKKPIKKIHVPSGVCPVELEGTDVGNVTTWLNQIKEVGEGLNKEYNPSAIKYWLREFYEVGTYQFIEVCKIIDRLNGISEKDYTPNQTTTPRFANRTSAASPGLVNTKPKHKHPKKNKSLPKKKMKKKPQVLRPVAAVGATIDECRGIPDSDKKPVYNYKSYQSGTGKNFKYSGGHNYGGIYDGEGYDF